MVTMPQLIAARAKLMNARSVQLDAFKFRDALQPENPPETFVRADMQLRKVTQAVISAEQEYEALIDATQK